MAAAIQCDKFTGPSIWRGAKCVVCGVRRMDHPVHNSPPPTPSSPVYTVKPEDCPDFVKATDKLWKAAKCRDCGVQLGDHRGDTAEEYRNPEPPVEWSLNTKDVGTFIANIVDPDFSLKKCTDFSKRSGSGVAGNGIFFVKSQTGYLVVKMADPVEKEAFAQLLAYDIGLLLDRATVSTKELPAPSWRVSSILVLPGLSAMFEDLMTSLTCIDAERTKPGTVSAERSWLRRLKQQAHTMIMGFMHGDDLFCPEIQSLVHTPHVMVSLGAIAAFDLLINNWDRIPITGVWDNEGNPGNVMIVHSSVSTPCAPADNGATSPSFNFTESGAAGSARAPSPATESASLFASPSPPPPSSASNPANSLSPSVSESPSAAGAMSTTHSRAPSTSGPSVTFAATVTEMETDTSLISIGDAPPTAIISAAASVEGPVPALPVTTAAFAVPEPETEARAPREMEHVIIIDQHVEPISNEQLREKYLAAVYTTVSNAIQCAKEVADGIAAPSRSIIGSSISTFLAQHLDIRIAPADEAHALRGFLVMSELIADIQQADPAQTKIAQIVLEVQKQLLTSPLLFGQVIQPPAELESSVQACVDFIGQTAHQFRQAFLDAKKGTAP